MVLKCVKSDHYTKRWISSISTLHDNPLQFYDVEVQVGTAVIKCHKLILALKSTFFQQRLFPPVQLKMVHHIQLDGITPEEFKNVMRFIYKGVVEMDAGTVARMFEVAKLLNLEELQRTCLLFMRQNLDAEHCVQFWSIAEQISDSNLRRRCLKLFSQEFVRVIRSSRLQDISPEMMKAALGRDDIVVSSESKVCDALLSWLDARLIPERTIDDPMELLTQIRWSGVPIEYVKSTMIKHEILTKNQKCFEFVSKVISYRLSGVQFPGLRTHYRPSTELENYVVIFGFNNGVNVSAECCRVSLQSGTRATDLEQVPSEMQPEVTACVYNNVVYLSGIGAMMNETWRWDSIGRWKKCGDLIQGRRKHSAGFVSNTSLYALGGWVDESDTSLSSVEQFDTLKNKWTVAGELVQSVANAGCVSYETSVYLFGGRHRDKTNNKDVTLDCVQEYNTSTEQCTVLTQRLPKPTYVLRAVLWDKTVILMAGKIRMLFDLDEKTVQQRDRFAAGLSHFGLTIDNQTLFVVGGGNFQHKGKTTWTCTDEVKSIPVMDIVNNEQTVNWTLHAKLSAPRLVQAYTHVALSTK